MLEVQSLDLLLIMAAIGLAWLLLVGLVMYWANGDVFSRFHPSAPPAPPIEPVGEDEEPEPGLEPDEPMAVVILTTSRTGPGRPYDQD